MVQPRAKPQLVAVKKFFRTFTKYFGREQENMGRIAKSTEHDHILKAIGAFESGSECHIIFPWADGGNLNEFWRKTNAVPQDAKASRPLVLWCLEQIWGIADALSFLHTQGYRHGDLKPENLLHITDGKGLGRLVVADFGLAKLHLINTMKREDPSTSWHATFKYEPPDVLKQRDSPRSRQFDMWSAGCCFLEFATWLGGGWSRLQHFRNSETFDKFWQREEGQEPLIHRRVLEEISLIRKYAGKSAIKDIVELVQNRLLKVKLSRAERLEDEPKDMDKRANSIEAKCHLETVLETARKDSSYCIGQRLPPRPGEESNQVTQPLTQQETYRVEQMADLVDSWNTLPDNDFASALFRRPDWVPTAPPTTVMATRCDKCSAIDFLSPHSDIPFDQAQLQQESDNCGICAVIQDALSNLGWTKQSGIIVRVGSEFKVSSRRGRDFSALSMYADPGTPTEKIEGIAQLGYPDLPRIGSPQDYVIIRAWLETCNTDRKCYLWKTADDLPPMPTRVIYVGSKAKPDLRLVETAGKQLKAKYVALSYCWGQLADKDKFCTTNGTRKHNIKSIPFRRLPKSFRDAVTVTREIEVQYLWIDSICIIQGDDGDWATESQKMGDVFGSAYCNLAASSAKSSIEGFLGPEGSNEPRVPRVSRKTAAVTTPDGTNLYLCRSIDNFRDDVEGSVLASRGWVFQERALSRRTIHFTSTQLYWECGHGVRCETLTSLEK